MKNHINGLIVAAVLMVANGLDLSHSGEQEKPASVAATTMRPIEEFKNHEQLCQMVLPDVSHLADKFREKTKYGFLVSMLDLWKTALLSDGRFQVSKGKI